MKECPKCKKEHTKNGIFCSRSCANSRIFSNEAKHKKSIALKGKPAVKRFCNVVDSKGEKSKTPYNKELWLIKIRATRLQKYLDTPFDQLGMENRRRRVFEEQNHCCNRCELSEWQGMKLSLELEHKDGNTTNNSRENLEGLCPNCHSITDTWRGRNKPARNGMNEVTDEFLLQCLMETSNIRQGLLKAGIAAKGNNYARAKRLLGSK